MEPDHQSSLLVAGVDEAGRGPLAGPVVAAAVILRAPVAIQGLADSKKLTANQRERLAVEIRNNALAWSVARVDNLQIDRLNILRASLLAMEMAIAELTVKPEHVLVDGNHCPSLPFPVQAIVRGDQTVPAISAASILAKVSRDAEMVQWDKKYPGYGFAKHKGYPTREHLLALEKLGICDIHRRSYGPVQRSLHA